MSYYFFALNTVRIDRNPRPRVDQPGVGTQLGCPAYRDLHRARVIVVRLNLLQKFARHDPSLLRASTPYSRNDPRLR